MHRVPVLKIFKKKQDNSKCQHNEVQQMDREPTGEPTPTRTCLCVHILFDDQNIPTMRIINLIQH